MPVTQDTYPIQIATPFAADKLTLKNLRGEERISGLYRYTVEMVSADDALDLSAAVGKDITVTMMLANGNKQYLHGMVSRFVHAGTGPRYSTYHADVYPKLWLLTLRSNCRIFQNKTTVDIIDAVLQEAGVTDVKKSLTGTYAAREFCVQYGETDFDFLSRLMEEEGIFYFFLHESGKHTLVLGDDSEAYLTCNGYTTIHLRDMLASWSDEESISECSIEEQSVTAKYKTADYNFEVPATDLVTTIGGGGSNQQLYDYPADGSTRDELEAKSKRVLEALQAPKRILRGASPCAAFRAGARFTLAGHSRGDVNTDYVIRRLSFRADQSALHTNSFEAQPVSVPFRPPRSTPRPRIYGTQTALVVGKDGDEIMADQYGRIRVHFHWDTAGERNEKASCAIRVAQIWAGKQWGALFTPRVGQEVVVSFLNGNPDHPIVIGSVYNGNLLPPYDPSSEPTKSTIKSHSSPKDDEGGFNEIRLEDKKGSEELFIHAQKDCKVEVLNDQTITVKKNRTATIQEADETLVVEKGNRAIKINKGNETHDVKGTRTLTITDAETHNAKADYTLNVKGNYSLNVDGTCTIKVKGNITIQTDTGTVTIKGNNIESTAQMGLTNKGLTVENNAQTTLTNKGGASQTVEAGGILTLKGAMTKIN